MAVTGLGNFPLRSPWLGGNRTSRRGKFPLLYKSFINPDTIYAQPTIWNDWFFDAAIVGTTGQIKYWDGAAWTAKPVKYWNGSAWTTKPIKYWNGSAWTTTNY
jgi:hypothetical protein